MGLFRTLAFPRYLWAFSVGEQGHVSQHSNILVALGRPNIGKEQSLAFFIEFERHTLQCQLSQNLGIGLCEIRFVQKLTHFESCCHPFPKSGLNLTTNMGPQNNT